MKFFEQWNKFSEAMIEMPFVAVKSLFAQNGEGRSRADAPDGSQQAGWKAYDAWVQLLNESANGLYASPAVGTPWGARWRLPSSGSAWAQR